MEHESLDSKFYLNADAFFQRHASVALTYDDVTLATLYSDVLPRDANPETILHERLRLSLPIITADMDTVTESRMAIGVALQGGLGLLHANMDERTQLSELGRVKNNVHGLIQEPIKVTPEQTIGEVLAMAEKRGFTFRTFPVVDRENHLLGLLPGHVMRPRYAHIVVAQAMTPRSQVQVIDESQLGDDPIRRADRFFTENVGIHKLLVVDAEDRLRGLFTMSDVERILSETRSQVKPARDDRFRLMCGVSVGLPRKQDGSLDTERMLNHVHGLVDRGADAIAISTAHGFSAGVGQGVRLLRNAFPDLPIIAGNVTSEEAVEFLAKSGANIIKVGQGPGSICTTRMIAGVGIPQFTALYVCSKAAARCGVKILADGGITKSGDIVKALTLAHGVICGGLLAGCPEAPGQVLEIEGKLYKQYRGMGSHAAMASGSAARYGHSKKDNTRKVAAEGIEALKEVSPPLDHVLSQLVGGIQSGMGYLGARNLEELRSRGRFIRVTQAGLKESAPHDVVEVKTSAKD